MKTFLGVMLVAAALGTAGCSGKHDDAAGNVAAAENGADTAALPEDNLTAVDGAGLDNATDNAAAGDLNSSGELSNATENTAG